MTTRIRRAEPKDSTVGSVRQPRGRNTSRNGRTVEERSCRRRGSHRADDLACEAVGDARERPRAKSASASAPRGGKLASWAGARPLGRPHRLACSTASNSGPQGPCFGCARAAERLREGTAAPTSSTGATRPAPRNPSPRTLRATTPRTPWWVAWVGRAVQLTAAMRRAPPRRRAKAGRAKAGQDRARTGEHRASARYALAITTRCAPTHRGSPLRHLAAHRPRAPLPAASIVAVAPPKRRSDSSMPRYMPRKNARR